MLARSRSVSVLIRPCLRNLHPGNSTMSSGTHETAVGTGAHGADHLVGFHVSSAGGIWPAVLRAKQCNARAIAFFTRSNQRWECPELKEEDAEKFKALCAEHAYGAHTILPHGSYLTNLGSGDPAMREKSLKAVIDEVSRCKQLGLRMYNFHPGAATGGATREQCIQFIAQGINAVHAAVPDVCLVIENMAGQGSVVGVTLAEIRDMIAGVADKNRVGVCIDTAHAHGAGIDVSTPQAMDKLLADFDSTIGLKYLRGMHLNDSRALLGSRRDLHQNIGRGHIGIEGFRAIMNEKRLAGIPLILETPCPNGSETQIYRDEIALLYGLVGTAAGMPVTLPQLTSPTAKAAKAGATASFKENMDENGKIPRTPGSGKRRKGEQDEEGDDDEDGGDEAIPPRSAAAPLAQSQEGADMTAEGSAAVGILADPSKGRKRKNAEAKHGSGKASQEHSAEALDPASVPAKSRKRGPKGKSSTPAGDAAISSFEADGSAMSLHATAPLASQSAQHVPVRSVAINATASASVIVKPSRGKQAGNA